jgi:hypothetical protein
VSPTSASVVLGDEPAGKHAAGLDRFELGTRDVVAPEEAWPERPRSVTVDEEVDVADVIRLEDHDHRGRMSVEPFPGLAGIGRRGKRVEQRHLAAGLDHGRGDERLPVQAGPPGGMVDSPEPRTTRDIPHFRAHPAI